MAELRTKKQRLQLIRVDLPRSFRSLAARYRIVFIEHVIDIDKAAEPSRSPGSAGPGEAVMTFRATTAAGPQVRHVMINLGLSRRPRSYRPAGGNASGSAPRKGHGTQQPGRC